MRAITNISLPLPLKQWVDRQVDEGGFGTVSEYVRQFLREEQRRQGRLAVEAKLRQAEASSDPVPVAEKTWTESQERVAQRLRAKSRKRKPDGEDH